MASGRISVIALIFIILLFISGCASGRLGSGGFITDSTAVDIVNYVNQGLLRIAELERRSLETYASVMGENYTTDQRVYEALRDFVIPVYKRFLDALRDIRPENEEVKRVHVLYIQAAELTYDGFKTKMLGIENSNEDIANQGHEKIEEGLEEFKKAKLELFELYKKHGVGGEIIIE